MTKIGLSILLITISIAATAQGPACPSLPECGHWASAADYARSRDSVEKVISWLCRTPLGYYVQERSRANACVLQWLAGSPDVRLKIDTRVLPFLAEDQELLFPFIHGYAHYALSHPKEADPVKLHVKGLETLAELCAQSETLSREKYLRPLFKAHRKGELKEYAGNLMEGPSK